MSGKMMITLEMPLEMVHALTQRATATDRSRSAVIRQAVRFYLAQTHASTNRAFPALVGKSAGVGAHWDKENQDA